VAVMAYSEITDVRSVVFARHAREDGELSVLEGADLPFEVARLFFVRASAGAYRGMHAHKRCSQFMICVTGAIEVICDDGDKKQILLLDQPNLGLLVPASIWATEIYQKPNSILAVACDRPYEEDDYIRDYDVFRRYRAASNWQELKS
jgi:dTDP-4-dehydrorhamnose 3,5-epimerase-like enzyme